MNARTRVKDAPGRQVFSTLTIGLSSIDTPFIVISTCLIDIALMFGVSISLAGQIRTASSLIGIIAALGMGVLSVRFNYKSILTTGILISLLSALGCAFAPSFAFLFITYSAMGLVSAMVIPMTDVYVGEYYTGKRLSSAVGAIFALRTLSFMLAVQIISFIAGRWSWRYSFLIFIAPYSLLSMFLARKMLPSHRSQNPDVPEKAYLDGYRVVLSSRSAIACLIGTSLAAASWVGMITYVTSYLRDNFLLSQGQASLVLSVLSLGVLIGSYAGGRLVNRFGRKNLVVITLSLVGLLMMGLMKMPDLKTTMILISVMSIVGGIRFTASNTLNIEQVPSVRGTFMSMNMAAGSLGAALGSGIGGLALYLHGWGLVGISLGTLAILAMCVFQLLAVDLTWRARHTGGKHV